MNNEGVENEVVDTDTYTDSVPNIDSLTADDEVKYDDNFHITPLGGPLLERKGCYLRNTYNIYYNDGAGPVLARTLVDIRPYFIGARLKN